MHLSLITRGIESEVRKWREHMSSQYLTWGKTGVQLAVRPIQLWELVFPEEHLPVILKTLNWQGKDARKDINLPLAVMRTALKLKKIPNIDITDAGMLPIPQSITDFTAPIPIGIREDKGRWPAGTICQTSGVDISGLEQL